MASNKNYMLNDKFPKQIKNATSTSDGLLSAEDKSRLDNLFEFGALTPATPDKDGIITKEDKAKLDGVEDGANNYIHPNNENIRHVTDEQITIWTNKADAILVTDKLDGLMSSEDKKKLDSIDPGASNYEHPVAHPATMIVEDSTHRFVTDEQIITWDGKASTNTATQKTDGLMSASDKLKLDSIDAVTGNYTHPETHPAAIIVEDSTHRFVTDEEKENWNTLIQKVTRIEEQLKTAVFFAE